MRKKRKLFCEISPFTYKISLLKCESFAIFSIRSALENSLLKKAARFCPFWYTVINL